MSAIDWFLRLLFPSRRTWADTGVRSAGRDELHVELDGRRYWVYAELQGRGPVDYVVHTTSVKDITNQQSVNDAPAVSGDLAQAVIARVRRFHEDRRIKVEYQ
jgi:hypothetical protein